LGGLGFFVIWVREMFLELRGREVPERRVSSAAVEEDLDVREDFRA
jgi:hypothetical protein